MTDWADEIESAILRGTGVNGPDGGVIAAALRKAKADGYTEAAKIMVKAFKNKNSDDIAWGMEIWNDILSARDKLTNP